MLNTNPRLLVTNKSPKRHIGSPPKKSTFENTARNPGTEQLILHGNVVLPNGGNRLNSDVIDDQSCKYRDYLKGNYDVAENSSSTMRVYTPTLEGWQKMKPNQNQVPV